MIGESERAVTVKAPAPSVTSLRGACWRTVCMVMLMALAGVDAASANHQHRLPSGVQMQLPSQSRKLLPSELPHPAWETVIRGHDDSGNGFALAEVVLPWPVSLFLKVAPELAMTQFEDRAAAEIRKHLKIESHEPLHIESMSISGFPAIYVELNRDSAGSASVAGAAPQMMQAREMAAYIILMEGRFVVAAVWGAHTETQRVTFFDTIRMPYERVPGDEDAQFRWLCILSGVVLLMALGLVLGAIVVVDKMVRRRKQVRLARP